jgi:photosystem II Psb28-2 protein
MNNINPTIEFFTGISEQLSDVSLRRNKSTGVKTVLMTFNNLKALEKFNSFTKQFSQSIILKDEEGEITVQPSSVKIIFGGDDGDDLQGVKCNFEIDKEEHWQRFMRFMDRYAEANDMIYGEKNNE